MFAHVNALQRDMCPSQTKFEGEVIAMALDLMHAEAVTDGEPAGLVTTGGTGSILHALIAYREHARETRGVTQPNFVKPETGHAAFDKGCHLFGIELRIAPVDPKTTLADVDAMAELIDDNTIAIMGSAGNYAYGTIDPIAELAALAAGARRRHARRRLPRRLHPPVRPEERELGSTIPVFDFRVPGVTIDLRRHPQVRLRVQGHLDPAVPRQGAAQRAVLPPARLDRRQVHVPGHGGLALRRPDRQHLGVDGVARPRGLPRAREGDLRDRRRDDGRRPLAPRAADHGRGTLGRADVLLLLHLATTSRSTTSSTSWARRAGGSTASSTPTRSTWPSPARRPRPAWSRRSRPTSPRRSTTPTGSRPAARRPSPARSTAAWPAGSTRPRATSSSPVMDDMLDKQQALPPA